MTINFLADLKKKPGVLWIIMVLILLIFAEIFFFKKPSDFVYIVFTVSWFWINWHYKVDSSVTVFAGICFLSLCSLFMFFNELLAMRLAVWAFLLLLCGTILLFKENEKDQRK